MTLWVIFFYILEVDMKVGIVGIGLIGGSFIKALKNKKYHVYGIDIDVDTVRAANNQNLILNDDTHVSLDQLDVLILCLHPKQCVSYLKDNQDKLRNGCIVSDVAGLKSGLIDEINSFLREDIYFIGGHPMAGKEGQGFNQSCASIFHKANYLLIQNETPKWTQDIMVQLVKDLNCGHIEWLEAKEHDEIIAYTSHMPHLLASLLVLCNEHESTKHCIAGSYKDITRVADLNIPLWSELFYDNRLNLIQSIESFESQLSLIKQHLSENNMVGLTSLLSTVVEKRNEIIK
jgi:prephenate dehydrogenase